MNTTDFLSRIEGAGFTIGLMGGNLAVSPASCLNDRQRDFIRSHREELVAAIRASESFLDDAGGHDLLAANDERVVVHVPDYQAQNGKRYSFDLNVPKVHLPALRRSLRFELKDDQGGGSILGKPGSSVDEVREVLVRKYGDRLQSINGGAPC